MYTAEFQREVLEQLDAQCRLLADVIADIRIIRMLLTPDPSAGTHIEEEVELGCIYDS